MRTRTEQSLPTGHFDMSYRPVVHPDTVVRQVDSEAIVWAKARTTPMFLDPVASLLYSVFDGVSTCDEIVTDVEEAIGVDAELAEAQLRRVVLLLAQAGVLDHAGYDDEPGYLVRNLLPEPNW